MLLYGILLILLPISMAGVLAMPGHHHKPTPHRRPHHGHWQDHPNHLPASHPVRHHHRHHLDAELFDDNKLSVLSLEESQNEHKRDQRHIEHASAFVLEEDDLENHFEAKCGYTVEVVPCIGNNCTKQYLRHIKCNHTGKSHHNGYCIQTFRKVQMNCTGSSEKSTHLYTGCVFATTRLITKKLSSGNFNA